MKLGMPTLIELDSLEENASLCRRLGLSFIELNMNLPQFQVSGLKGIKLPSDIELTLHLPEEFNPWDFNEIIREAYLELMENIIEIAINRNIEIINMHMNPGIYFTLPDERVFLFRKYRDRFLENTRRFAERASRMMKGTDIAFCIENTGIYDNDFIVEALQELLRHNYFKLTWDTGHDHSSGNKDKAFIEKNINKLVHLHLHDAAAGRDHLPLGTGELDFEEIISDVEARAERAVLETKTVAGLEQSVQYLREIGII